MAAGNPNWWSMNNMHPSTIPSSSPSPSLFTLQYAPDQSSLQAFNSLGDHNQDFPQSWSQMLMGGLASEEDRIEEVSQFESKKLENWDVKEESRQPNGHGDDESQAHISSWSQSMPFLPVSSTTNILELDFSTTNRADGRNQNPDYLSECNSRVNGGMSKKLRLDQPSSTQPPLKVRKEKLGDRITALHQLVSPFGKTDTASVLLEAIGCIRFLQGQIEALSSPYLGNASQNKRQQHQQQYQRPLLNDSCLNRREASKQQDRQQDEAKDLRSRGLCLVPVSCTDIRNTHVGSSNIDSGADYWAPTLGGGF